MVEDYRLCNGRDYVFLQGYVASVMNYNILRVTIKQKVFEE